MITPLLAITLLNQTPTLADLPLIGNHFVQNLPTDLPRRGALGLSFAPPTNQTMPTGIESGKALVARAPVPGLTAEQIGFKENDLILKFQGQPVTTELITRTIRESKPGTTLTFEILRDGKPLTLSGPLMEKPRDPGNANYDVIYSHIVSHGQRMRTIITTPKKPGKHPGFFFIQGFSPISYDYTLATSTGDVTSLDGPILHEFANSNFVTIRVEKPGVGDSEGGPFAPMDYITELDIYRQTLKQLKGMGSVDTDNVFIFGHSMGGSFGPMIAAENPVKGIAVYGTASRTWFEYILDTIRYQSLVGGATFEQVDAESRIGAQLMALVMLEKKSVEDVKKSHPHLAEAADAYFPGGLFNGKSLDFWRQLADTNFASYWAKLDSHVLAVKGESDFVVYDADHKLIADIINRKNPGYGKFVVAENSDHLFHEFDTEPDSMRNFQRGKFTSAFTKIMKEWILEVMKRSS